jgi:hypothetical protein
MITTITLVRESDTFSVDELRQMCTGIRMYVERFCEEWNFLLVKVQYSDHAIAGTFNVFITERKRVSSAYGYHLDENGLPVAYVSPNAIGLNKLFPLARKGALWGVYIPEQKDIIVASLMPVILPKTKLGLKMAGAKAKAASTKVGAATIIKGSPALYFPGLVAVISHEVAEALVDPAPLLPGVWKTDADGNDWLVEVGDQANAAHFVVESVTTLLRPKWVKVKGKLLPVRVMVGIKVNQTQVVADYTLPSFYDLKGTSPFSHTNSIITAPFQHVALCYAWIRNATGGTLVQFANPADAS